MSIADNTTPGNALRLGIAGLGTVGAGVIALLREHGGRAALAGGRAVEVNAVCARDRTRDRGIDLNAMTWFDDPVALARSPDVDVFVELIGGEDGPAHDSVVAALDAGKSVVTANKALIAHHGAALAARAEANGVALKFEAAVAGGIPIIKVVRESVWANDISCVYGILNGTCNFISTLMSQGRDFADALREAQEAGYAEADPTFDVEGYDAAHKLAILASLCFGTQVAFDAVRCEGISGITKDDIDAADALGYVIKLLGVAVRTPDGIEQRVHPAMVPKGSAIAGVNGVRNAVALEGDHVGPIMLVGRGAGAGPTASSVVSDIIDVARGDRSPAFVQPVAQLAPPPAREAGNREGAFYLRFTVEDRIGVMASVAQHMAEQQISLESIVQHRSGERLDLAARRAMLPREVRDGDRDRKASIEIITHATREANVRAAIGAIDDAGVLAASPQLIRIESF